MRSTLSVAEEEHQMSMKPAAGWNLNSWFRWMVSGIKRCFIHLSRNCWPSRKWVIKKMCTWRCSNTSMLSVFSDQVWVELWRMMTPLRWWWSSLPPTSPGISTRLCGGGWRSGSTFLFQQVTSSSVFVMVEGDRTTIIPILICACFVCVCSCGSRRASKDQPEGSGGGSRRGPGPHRWEDRGLLWSRHYQRLQVCGTRVMCLWFLHAGISFTPWLQWEWQVFYLV